jgi:uncharacterized protein
MHQPRTYRERIQRRNLISFRVAVRETDLHIQAGAAFFEAALESTLRHRGYLESYIRRHPEFATTLSPWPLEGPAAEIVQAMIRAGRSTGVGPMAAVAGAMAEAVGKDLMPLSEEVIVENGGDIFLKVSSSVVVGLYAGSSPLSMKIGLHLPPRPEPFSVCTSSGTVGHSLSMGKADAVCVLAGSAPLADAAATAIGNRIASRADLEKGIEFGKNIDGVRGIVTVAAERIAAWGELEIVPIAGKKG